MSAHQAPPDALADRIILITGAGAGIGQAAALAFADHGATVVLLERYRPRLENVYDEIEKRGGKRPAMIQLDLADANADHYAALADTVEQEFGRLDGLLHNAAELGALAPIEHYEPAHWERVLRVNLSAAFLLTRACLPLLKRSNDASIIFTTADVGRKGRAYWGAYGATAFALEGLSQTLADELAANTSIRVNTIDPGPVRTDFRAQAYPGETKDTNPLPDAIMDKYLYLMGPASRGVTGQAFNAQAAL
nr:hypothetical protein [uncultured bacterium]